MTEPDLRTPGLLADPEYFRTAVKVKRFFMHMAEKLGHPWAGNLDPARVDSGKGKRMSSEGEPMTPSTRSRSRRVGWKGGGYEAGADPAAVSYR
jgi:hypothetical protein